MAGRRTGPPAPALPPPSPATCLALYSSPSRFRSYQRLSSSRAPLGETHPPSPTPRPHAQTTITTLTGKVSTHRLNSLHPQPTNGSVRATSGWGVARQPGQGASSGGQLRSGGGGGGSASEQRARSRPARVSPPRPCGPTAALAPSRAMWRGRQVGAKLSSSSHWAGSIR